MLKLSNLSYTTPDGITLFSDLNAGITLGQKVGLIGVNGSGKTTLLKIIAGIFKPEAGTLLNKFQTCYVNSSDILKQISKNSKFAEQTFQELTQVEAWQIISTYSNIFQETPPDINQTIGTFSGGELTKLLLSAKLSRDNTLVLVDEPTNHIDSQSIEQLKTYIQNSKKAFIIVSHNYEFVADTCDTTWEIKDNTLEVYGGNVFGYLAEKQRIINKNRQEYSNKIQQISRAMKVANTKQSSARTMHLKFGSTHPYFEKKAGKKARQARLLREKLDRQLRKAQAINPILPKEIYISLINTDILRICLISITHVKLRIRDHLLINDLSFKIYSGDKIGLIGKNGSGKSSLIQAITNQLIHSSNPQTLTGKIDINPETRSFTLSQKFENLSMSQTALQNLMSTSSHLSQEAVIKLLSDLLIPNTLNPVSNLSSGQLTRLAIAKAEIQDSNLVLADEPTNNLDEQSVTVLQNVIAKSNKAFILASHDIEFLKGCGIQQFLLLENGSATLTNL